MEGGRKEGENSRKQDHINDIKDLKKKKCTAQHTHGVQSVTPSGTTLTYLLSLK